MLNMAGHLLKCVLVFIVVIVKAACQCDEAPLTLTADSRPKHVNSSNYVDDYSGNVDCYWLLLASGAGSRVIINVEDVDVRGTGDCNTDYVNVYDGASNEGQLLASICDKNEAVNNVFVSTGNALLLWLHTDDTNNDGGFRALYFNNDTTLQADCSDNALTASSNTEYLMSANLPDVYSPDYNCTTFIQTESTLFVLRIILILLDLEESTDCTGDVLIISEGTTTSNLTTVSTQCTTADTHWFKAVTTQHQLAAITMATDSVQSKRYGYFLGYKQVQNGVDLTFPEEGQTVSVSIPEDHDVGVINASQARIDVTSDGVISFTLLQDGVASSDLDFEVESGADQGTYYISLVRTLDYETNSSHTLTCIVWDDVNPGKSGTVHFNISLTDVDDNAPVMTNLPGNTTVRRTDTAGLSVLNVTSTDADTTEAFQIPAYMIFSGNSDGLLQVDEVTGEITLARPASIISVSVTSYPVTIAAFSVSLSSGIASFATFTLYLHPDAPPVCSHVIAVADMIGADTHGKGFVITISDPWHCTDETSIQYSLGTVSPSPDLFSINKVTGEISLTRGFVQSEVPTRQFNLTLIATDFLDQTTEVTVLINVTTLTCHPNPRKLYVRMGTALGTSLVSDYNCSSPAQTISIKHQHPEETFGVLGSSVVLLSDVFKIRYYFLTLRISDGADTTDLTFTVTVQMRQCNSMLNNAPVTLHVNMAAMLTIWFAWLVS